MLRIDLPVVDVLARVRSELSFSQPDDRRSRLYLLRSMLERASRYGTVSVDEELFRFLDM